LQVRTENLGIRIGAEAGVMHAFSDTHDGLPFFARLLDPDSSSDRVSP
jgi:hypothetical protein